MRRLATILAGLLVVTACSQTPPTSQPSAGPEEKPVAGGRLVIGSTGDPKTMNPVIGTDTQSSAIYERIYQGLLRRDATTGKLVGHLAETYEASADGLAVTYTLRDNLVWSDGTPFTGRDYKYTAEAVMRSKKTVRQSTFDNVVGAKDYKDGKTDGIAGITLSGPNDKVITVKLTSTYCPAIEDLSGAGAGYIIPADKFKQYWDSKTTDTSKTIDDNPMNLNPTVAMGPWMFKEFKPGDRVTLVKNPKYFKGEPLLDELVIKVYADATAVKNALLTREVTYASVEPKDFDEMSKQDFLRSFEFPTFGWTYLAWNSRAAKAPWLNSVDVRQALTYGINRQAIMDKIIFGHGKLVNQGQPPGNPAYSETDINKYAYDVNKAKQLLEKAGAKMGTDGIYRWTDGTPMKMKIETNQGNTVRETILQFAQDQYKQIGIQIEPLLESFNALLDRTKCCSPDTEGFIIGLTGLGPDPDHKDIWHSTATNAFNKWGYSNADVDKWLDQGRNGPDCSEAARNQLAHQVDKQLNQDAPIIFIYSPNALIFADKTLQNFAPTQYSTSRNVEKWWFKK
jgi:peptide/nickel transport system substrate-binding protein